MYYNKPQEIEAILRIIESYMTRRDDDFKEAQKSFIDHTKYYSNLTIKSDNDFSNAIWDLNNLKEAKEKYEKAKSIYNELKKIYDIYNEGFLKGTPQNVIDSHLKKANNLYHEFKTKPEFIDLMKEAAIEVWSFAINNWPESTLFRGLEYGLEGKLDELSIMFDDGKIDRDTYIYYAVICPYLYDTPEFKERIKYMQQSQSMPNVNTQKSK